MEYSRVSVTILSGENEVKAIARPSQIYSSDHEPIGYGLFEVDDRDYLVNRLSTHYEDPKCLMRSRVNQAPIFKTLEEAQAALGVGT